MYAPSIMSDLTIIVVNFNILLTYTGRSKSFTSISFNPQNEVDLYYPRFIEEESDTWGDT